MMYKSLCFILAMVWIHSTTSAQLKLHQLEFYVGSGTDTTMLVVDFKDGTFDSSYAWGYIYSGSKTGEDMLNAIAAADQNFNLNIDTASFGNFLQDITYIRHEGLGGSPDFWGTWDGSDMSSLSANNGIASALIPGGIFGASYMDFNPAIAPGYPLQAYDPNALKFDMINNWYGSGSDSLVMIIDFSDSTDTTSYAWGYLFNDSISYLSVLNDLDLADTSLSLSISGAVTSISYRGLSGMVGALADWYIWEAENWGNWRLRYSDEVYLHPGDFGAVVYTRLLQPVRPKLPVNINNSIGVEDISYPTFEIYPNPTSQFINIPDSFDSYELRSASGKSLLSGTSSKIELHGLPVGIYFLEIKTSGKHSVIRKVMLR